MPSKYSLELLVIFLVLPYSTSSCSIACKVNRLSEMFQVMMFDCSTTENLAVKIWSNMASLMTQFPGVDLHKVKVHETDKNVVTYRGEMTE